MARARRKQGRAVNGMIIIDKAQGFTSNAVLQQVKHCFGANKAGHTGSLDPIATGVLPICLGEATKFSQFLLASDKSYRVVIQLGIKTTTGDAEGEVLERRPVGVTGADVAAVLPQFQGEVMQIPSMYSALKYQGQPLYQLARQGITVDRPPRKVLIHRIQLLALDQDCLTLAVDCSKGTYIRTLAEDIGDALGCLGHVIALRRLTVGPYTEQTSHTVEALHRISYDAFADKQPQSAKYQALDSLLLPIDSAVRHWPAVRVGQASRFYLTQGQAVQVPQAPTQGYVRLYGTAPESAEHGCFLGVGAILDDGRVAPKRLVSSLQS